MKLTINTELEADKFFGGAVHWPIGCKVSIANRDYILLKFDLVQENLDLSEVINSIFHLSLTEGKLIAKKLGFVMLAQVSSTVEVRKLKDLFPELSHDNLPVILQTLPSSTTPSLCFWGSIELNKIECFNSLIEIGYSSEKLKNDLTIIAQISNQHVLDNSYKEVMFEADFPEVRLFQILTFSQVKFRFMMGNHKTFWLQGAIYLSLFENDYTFAGQLEVNEELCRAKMEVSKGRKDVPKLFDGAMTGMSFEEGIQLCIEHKFKSKNEDLKEIKDYTKTSNYDTVIYVGGKVPIGEAKLVGYIYLMDGKPKLVVASLDSSSGSLSISSLVHVVCPSIPWPSEFIDLTIFPESNVYYFQSDQPDEVMVFDQRNYHQGFHAYLKMRLRLFVDFDMEGLLSIQKDGVKAALLLTKQEIDFIICKFGPAKDQTGILFYFSTMEGQKTFGLKCSISIFQLDLGDLEVQCGKYAKNQNEIELRARLDLTNLLGKEFTNLLKSGEDEKVVLEMCYSKTGGFHLTNWPIFDLPECVKKLAEILKEIIESTNKDLCSMAWDILSKDALQVTYEVSPNFREQEIVEIGQGNQEKEQISNKKSYTLDLDLTVHFWIVGLEVTNSTMNGIIVVPLESSLSMNQLPQLLLDSIEASLESIVEKILEQPEVLGILITYLAGDKAIEYALSLLCKGLIDAAAAAAIGAAGTTFAEVIKDAATAAGIIIAGKTFFEILKKLSKKKKEEGDKQIFIDAEEEYKKKYKEKYEEEREHQSEEEEYTPETPEIRYVTEKRTCIVVGWNDTEYTDYYEVYLWDQDGKCKYSKMILISEASYYLEEDVNYLCEISIEDEMKGHEVKITLCAKNNKKQSEIVSYHMKLQALDPMQDLIEYMDQVGYFLTKAAYISEARVLKLSAIECYSNLVLQFPFSNSFDMILIMYENGYPLNEILQLIRSEINACKDRSDVELYEKYFMQKNRIDLSVDQIIKDYRELGYSEQEVIEVILQNYPYRNRTEIEQYLKNWRDDRF